MTDSFSQQVDDLSDDLTEGNIDRLPTRGDFSNTRSGGKTYSDAKKLHRDYDLDIKNHYRVEAGQNSPYGNISYRVLTNGGSGFAFCEDGINRENLPVSYTHLKLPTTPYV